MSLRPELKLDWCSYKAAKFAVEHWHYSRKMPANAGKSVKVGVWEGGLYIGCILYCYGATKSNGMRYGFPAQTQVCELARVALSNHVAPVSRMIAISLRMLHEAAPGLHIVFSYADDRQGHIGGIYKAGGWIYLGMVDTGSNFIESGGKVYHHRTFTGKNFNSGKRKMPLDAKRVHGGYRYKYAYPLTNDARAALLAYAKPYPKRAVSIDNDAPATHAGEGGEIPTTALHISE